uniref:Reactive oxygen species modulator 1 n=1 Tax=Strongyloides stercoralis TaxID=6248 RepID=A0A0K0E9C6_STRER
MPGYSSREPISDIVKKYKEAGSCSEEFKKTLVKSVKIGFYGGIVLGAYIAFRMKHTTVKHFASNVFFTSMVSTAAMGGTGIMIGTYNCFNI